VLFRVSGKLVDDRPFVTRIDSEDIFSAVGNAGDSLRRAGVTPKVLIARPLDGKSSIHIGKVREKKTKAAKAPAAKK